MRKIISLFFIFILTFLFSGGSFAQEGDWEIQKYESKINVQENGEVNITEQIHVDFKNLEKHGIFRYIPYVYESENGPVYTEVMIEEIQRDGKREKFEEYTENNNRVFKIGDADITISGQHIYSITYIVRGAVVPYSDFDELYWNVTGDWPVPINTVEAFVTLPKDSLTQATCYQSYVGSTEVCKVETSSRSATFTTSDLLASEQMTVAVGFQKGTVPIITVERPKTFFEQIIEPVNIAIFILTGILGIGFSIVLWYRKGRDHWYSGIPMLGEKGKERHKPIGAHETIVVEYTPPEKLRPAELGVLMDERADTVDVTATIIDLASRGFLTIKEIPKKWVFGSMDYELKETNKSKVELLHYEALLLKGLFGDKKTVKTSELKNKFYKDLKKVKNALYAHVVEKKLFPKNPESVRNIYFIISIFIFPILIFGMIFIQIVPIQMFLAGVFIANIVFMVLSRSMSKRTAHGREMYRRARGYYAFISHVEKYRQQFFERKNMFNEVLPYAIMFGLTGKFAKALKDMGVEPQAPTWYTGYTAFHLATFDKNINSFSSSLSSAISSAPSSSGSGGGGSSGGGFGGGGGGSW